MPWKHITLCRLEVNNFKRFFGWHSLDLTSEPDLEKPIVLVGGNNGSGKSSLHEAINYALYEDEDLPGIQNRPSYLQAVSTRLNRYALDQGHDDYWVAVELLLADDGPERRIRIERHWDVNVRGRSVITSRPQLTEDGRPIDFLEGDAGDPGAYRAFLKNLIPPSHCSLLLL